MPFRIVDSAVRLSAIGKGIDLRADKYTAYLVSDRTVDVSKLGAATAKWRAAVYEPDASISFVRGSADFADEEDRLVHIFYGKIQQAVADLANMDGQHCLKSI